MAPSFAAQQRQVAALLKQFEPTIEAAFREAIAKAGNAVDMRALVEALDARNVEQAVALLRINQAMLFPLEDAIRGAYIAGGASVATTLPSAIRGGFGFNGRHVRAEAWVQSVGAELIQGIQDDTLAMAREAITRGLSEGRGAQTVARDIVGRVVSGKRSGGFIGLTSQQTDSIIAGRAKLASGDPSLMAEYLQLKQRNRSFDPMIKRAISEGKPLSAADLDKVIQAHKNKALGYRGKMIAKNETFTAQAAGRDEGYRQALDADGVETVTVRWQHNLSENPRPDHEAMNGTVISLGETFNFPDAQMKHPHDPAGGAKHSIGCRCVAVYRVQVAKD